ncbi:MAG TPA: hypothetical protein VGN33_07275 [Leifsonia sp.]|nr:hypothetical protein [Leifsonia sp.]
MSSRRLSGRRSLVFFGDSVTAAGRNPLVEGELISAQPMARR